MWIATGQWQAPLFVQSVLDVLLRSVADTVAMLGQQKELRADYCYGREGLLTVSHMNSLRRIENMTED